MGPYGGIGNMIVPHDEVICLRPVSISGLVMSRKPSREHSHQEARCVISTLFFVTVKNQIAADDIRKIRKRQERFTSQIDMG